MISSIITLAAPPIALVLGSLAARNPTERPLAILAIALSGIETLLLILLFLTAT